MLMQKLRSIGLWITLLGKDYDVADADADAVADIKENADSDADAAVLVQKVATAPYPQSILPWITLLGKGPVHLNPTFLCVYATNQ